MVMLSAAALAIGAVGGLSRPLTAHAASQTYFFHGTATDDASKAEFQPTATFDTTAPTNTGALGFTQAGEWPNDGPDFAESPFDDFWVGDFSGTVSGSVSFDWFWSSTDPVAVASGATVIVTVFADPVFGTNQGEIAQAHFTLNAGATPTENHSTLPLGTPSKACPCAVASQLLIEVSTTDFDPNGAQITAHYDSTAVPSSFAITSGVTTTPTPTSTPSPTPGPGATGPQSFHNYQAPYPYPHEPPPPSAVALLFGEPSIGVDWGTNTTMYQGDLNTWAVGFDYSVKPPTATWSDRSDVATDSGSLDARLITDHIGHDRTFVDQLAGAQSAQAYTDNDGGTTAPPGNSADWIAEPAGGFPSGVDHQSIAAGRYSVYTAPPAGAGTVYPHALYYCSQDVVSALGAFCARNDTGGAAWGSGVQVYGTQCGNLHGKPRVGPDGVVYLPNKNCSASGGATAVKGVVISKDNGATWTVVNIPQTTTDGNQSDSDVAVGGGSGMGTVYYAYRDGDHHAKVVVSNDDGTTWSTPIDVGSFFSVQNVQFPEVIAGDQGRAAVTFIGTTTSSTGSGGQGDPGDDLSDNFGCPQGQNAGCGAVWYLYVAFTYDAGATWQLVNATPNDPVQRGGVCMAGTACSGSDRNMLDFNDETIDNQGRVQVAYTDGCSASCETNPSAAACSVGNQNCMGKFSSVFSMVDQVCGMGLFARYDPGFSNDTSCASVVVTPEAFSTTALLVSGGAVAIALAFVGARRRRPGAPIPV